MNPVIGLEHGKVKLEQFNAQWDSLYLEEEKLLFSLFGNSCITIAHIGSTAIPGIRSKPIIDILLVMPDEYDCEQVQKELLTIGFIIGNSQIHEGIFFMKGGENIQTHHLHLMRAGQDWQGYIFFRDYLRTHEAEKQQYHKLKMELEKAFADDRVKYTASKKSFVQGILGLMEDDSN